jgi:hypothetical protein
MTQPGDRLRRFASRVCSPDAMTRLIDPVIADLQSEYALARNRDDQWRARGALAAGIFAFWKMLALHARGRVIPVTREWMNADDRAIGRVLAWSAVLVTLLTAPLVWLPLSHVRWVADPADVPQLILDMIPQAVLASLPIGFGGSVALAMWRRTPTKRAARSILAIASACSILMFVIAGWILPNANQAYRELAYHVHPPRGVNERTLGELWREGLGGALHFRLALACAPLVLTLFLARVLVAGRGRIAATILGLASILGYGFQYCLLPAPVEVLARWLPVPAAAWTPNLVFLTMTIALVRLKRDAAS